MGNDAPHLDRVETELLKERVRFLEEARKNSRESVH